MVPWGEIHKGCHNLSTNNKKSLVKQIGQPKETDRNHTEPVVVIYIYIYYMYIYKYVCVCLCVKFK